MQLLQAPVLIALAVMDPHQLHLACSRLILLCCPCCSVSPLFVPPDTAAAVGSGQGRSLDMMYSQAFARDSQLIRGDPRRAAHLACGLLARGDVQLSDVTRNVDRLKRELTMARWNPDGEH